MTLEEWKEIRNKIRYDYQQDNHFEELKQAEILRERLQTLRDIEEYVGTYYSREWIRKNVLQQSDDDIENIDKQVNDERESEAEEEPDINSNNDNEMNGEQ
jgi:hypothetical protein